MPILILCCLVTSQLLFLFLHFILLRGILNSMSIHFIIICNMLSSCLLFLFRSFHSSCAYCLVSLKPVDYGILNSNYFGICYIILFYLNFCISIFLYCISRFIYLPYFCSYKTSFWDLNFMSKVGGSSCRRGYKKCQARKNFLIEFSFFISCTEPSILAQCNRSTVFNWLWH
jgi:hypothetical protein